MASSPRSKETELLPQALKSLYRASGITYAQVFSDRARARVERCSLPGTDALNFVVPDSLGGSNLLPQRIRRLE